MPEEVVTAAVIGLVGGVASGKSHVANILVQMGAEMIDADKIAHQVLKKPLVARNLIQMFGEAISNEQGEIDRQALARLVFGADPVAEAHRKRLEAIVHPLIHADAVRRLRALNEREEGPPQVIVVDAPLLLEAGWQPICDVILFVETPEDTRQARALERGWTAEQFQSRENSQMSLDDKRTQATHVVDGQDESNLRSQLREIWDKLVS